MFLEIIFQNSIAYESTSTCSHPQDQHMLHRIDFGYLRYCLPPFDLNVNITKDSCSAHFQQKLDNTKQLMLDIAHSYLSRILQYAISVYQIFPDSRILSTEQGYLTSRHKLGWKTKCPICFFTWNSYCLVDPIRQTTILF